ncbi:hypothetical protein CDD82_2275 [Ophiocordyceps australis]|uniref:Uncharacterized protein n=1 Tax=Ophiocordyceps australis TaxID=1399860 RepID=A0A2C5ZMQ7_9HYPO|nr:hypothetical protein CDD82_2275 [Ophiocordyceps australis]
MEQTWSRHHRTRGWLAGQTGSARMRSPAASAFCSSVAVLFVLGESTATWNFCACRAAGSQFAIVVRLGSLALSLGLQIILLGPARPEPYAVISHVPDTTSRHVLARAIPAWALSANPTAAAAELLGSSPSRDPSLRGSQSLGEAL